jgi:hypothetical protein
MLDAPKTSSLASSPLYALLDKDTSQMSREELTKFINHIRTLRTSPPTFTKQLRDDEEIAEETAEASEKKVKKTKAPKTVDANAFLASLTARAALPKP